MSNDPFLIPEEVYRELVTRGEDWADAKAAADLKSDMVKVIKAEVFLSFKGENTIAGATELAYASSKYLEAIKDAAESGRLTNRARVRYDAAKALFEARRTSEATHRAAMGAAK